MKFSISMLFITLIGISIADVNDVVHDAFKNPYTPAVNLSHQRINHQGARYIVTALKDNTHLTSLDLSHNEIGAEGVSAILATSKNTAIDGLDLSYNTRTGWRYNTSLASALRNTKMSFLSLAGNWINEQDAFHIVGVLNTTRITSLDLADNQIGIQGAAAIINATKTQLITLNLAHTGIRTQGAIFLGKALPNTRLTTLDLSQNQIGNEGIAAIAEILKYTNITHLNLQSNRMDSEGATVLANVLPNTLITFLEFRYNYIFDDRVFDNISIILRHNQEKIDRLYEKFKSIVSENLFSDRLMFWTYWPCSGFTKTISEKKQGYISHFTAYRDSRYTKYQIEEFIENIEQKYWDSIIQ